jgi:Xaa-Pro aminopeptidase
MPYAPTAALDRRHAVVRAQLEARGLDALVVTALPNILYLTNFAGSSAIVVLTRDRLCFITDFRYLTAIAETRGAAHECPALEVIRAEGAYDAALADLIAAREWPRIGFEAAHMTVNRHQWLAAKIGANATATCQLVPTEGIVEGARVTKDRYEIGAVREAARRLSTVAVQAIAEVRSDRTEQHVAAAIDAHIRRAGFARTAFDTIVASGPNAALPHHAPGERRLTEGDLVVLDFGGVYDSYCVDLTRTVSIGPATERAREVYAAVLEAHDAAIRSVEPGRSRFEIDAAARRVLDSHGLGEAFGHGTGHGLGIEVHEDPRITRRRPDVDQHAESVSAGMIFTIEPGAYLAGWGGVRIEDDVLVTDEGVEVLTRVATDLIEI